MAVRTVYVRRRALFAEYSLTIGLNLREWLPVAHWGGEIDVGATRSAGAS
jgi:hypothetical protein